jgi:hypothetical protein
MGKKYNRKKINIWVEKHYINGPSTIAYKNLKSNEIQLLYDIDRDRYSIITRSMNIVELEAKYNIFYIVLRDELNSFLKSL